MFLRVVGVCRIRNEEGKDQESIQLSTKPDKEYNMGK